jgi:SdpC family antimicrobial peptide
MLQSKIVVPVILAVFATLLFTGCQDQVLDAASVPEEDTAPSGEVLFRGIMMGEGAVANEIPEIRDLYALENTIADMKLRQALKEFNDELVDVISTTQPKYFETFRIAMTSGNQLAIREEMQTANQVLLAALQEMPQVKELAARLDENPKLADEMLNAESFRDVDSGKIKDALYLLAAGETGGAAELELGELHCLAVGPFFLVAAAVHMYLAVTHSAAGAVQVYLYLAYWSEVATPEVQEKKSSLTLNEEQLINSIAVRYARAA